MLRSIQRHALSSRNSYQLIKQSDLSNTIRRIHSTKRVEALSKFTMPAMSPTMTEGGISSWRQKEGQSFSAGDILLEIETDKATMDVEAQDDGKLVKIVVGDGSKSVPVGKIIAITAEEGDEYSNKEIEDLIQESQESSPTSKSNSSDPQPASHQPSSVNASSKTSSSASGSPSSSTKAASNKDSSTSTSRQPIFATPAAKRIALERGIPLASIRGSGPNGRILESDLQKASSSSSSSSSSNSEVKSSFDDLPISNMRRTIAERLTASKRDVPHYYLTSEIQIDRISKLRELFNKAAEDQASSNRTGGLKAPNKLSINDFIIKAAALACSDVPEVNSSWHGDFIRQHKTVDISVAVATPTGLITPIVRDVGSRGLGSISSEVKALASKAKNNQLSPAEYQGGSFTISNLGMFGSSCILAVGGGIKRLVIDEEGAGEDSKAFKEVEIMKVTLSCDHRVVDGAVGARWLKAFKTYMESPLSFML
ncbi:2-oxoacid dehydrogenases acyltransferase-domain-containing protein [Phakopsora pachyrhizi]|nr:2-oxoacid dehydrogenases acyltransferase-domain-containing protein [Phakopsora pachyrhizi]